MDHVQGTSINLSEGMQDLTYRSQLMCYVGAKLWGALPEELKKTERQQFGRPL